MPSHIINDGYESTETEKLKGFGIIPFRQLQAFQSLISINLEHPTAIIEFLPDGSTVKIDSPILHYNIRSACEIFRMKTDKKLCDECDSFHANIFFRKKLYDLKKDDIIIQWRKSPEFNKFYEFKDGRYRCMNQIVSNITDRAFPYFEYDCPLLGYRELIFPIVINFSVIAVLFIGQILLEENEDLIIERMGSLSKRFPKYYLNSKQTALTKLKKLIRKKPLSSEDEIIEDHKKWIKNNPDLIYSSSDYQKFILNAYGEVQEFVSFLKESLDKQRSVTLQQNITTQTNELHNSLLPIKDTDLTLKILWGVVSTCLVNILNDFSLRYLIVLGVESIQKAEDISVVASAGEGIEKIYLSSLRAVFEKIPKENNILNNKDLKIVREILKGFNVSILGKFNMLVLSFQKNPLSTIIVLVGHYDNEFVWVRTLNAALNSFFTHVSSQISSICVYEEKQKNYIQLRYLSHEAGQQIAGIDSLIVKEIKNGENIPPFWAVKYYGDIEKSFKNIMDGNTVSFLSQVLLIAMFSVGGYLLNRILENIKTAEKVITKGLENFKIVKLLEEGNIYSHIIWNSYVDILNLLLIYSMLNNDNEKEQIITRITNKFAIIDRKLLDFDEHNLGIEENFYNFIIKQSAIDAHEKLKKQNNEKNQKEFNVLINLSTKCLHILNYNDFSKRYKILMETMTIV